MHIYIEHVYIHMYIYIYITMDIYIYIHIDFTETLGVLGVLWGLN